jgi:hypothetical protein
VKTGDADSLGSFEISAPNIDTFKLIVRNPLYPPRELVLLKGVPATFYLPFNHALYDELQSVDGMYGFEYFPTFGSPFKMAKAKKSASSE